MPRLRGRQLVVQQKFIAILRALFREQLRRQLRGELLQQLDRFRLERRIFDHHREELHPRQLVRHLRLHLLRRHGFQRLHRAHAGLHDFRERQRFLLERQAPFPTRLHDAARIVQPELPQIFRLVAQAWRHPFAIFVQDNLRLAHARDVPGLGRFQL